MVEQKHPDVKLMSGKVTLTLDEDEAYSVKVFPLVQSIWLDNSQKHVQKNCAEMTHFH